MTRNKKKNLYLSLGAGALIIVLGFFLNGTKNEDDSGLKMFAQCLENKGAKFYGAFWCSHCNAQKEIFGQAAKYLPYIECSTLDRKGQLPECQKNKITGYPTWVFADGSQLAGSLPLGVLAEKTACALPQA